MVHRVRDRGRHARDPDLADSLHADRIHMLVLLGTALAEVAAFLGAGEPGVLAQGVEQCRAWIDR
jgi:hypothetical protein